jgi:hypothetical protein
MNRHHFERLLFAAIAAAISIDMAPQATWSMDSRAGSPVGALLDMSLKLENTGPFFD